MIYFLKCNSYVKIGFTTNIKKRVSALDTAIPYNIQLLFWVDGNIEFEKTVHDIFSEWNHKKEWFKISEDRIIEILKLEFPSLKLNFMNIKNDKVCSVVRIDKNGNKKNYKTITEASIDTGIYHGSISRCCSGQRNTAGGFKWENG